MRPSRNTSASAGAANTMISIDTNVVVRFLAIDDEAQFERAKRVFETQDCFLPTSVLLESEWVLRTVLEFPKDEVLAALGGLIDLPRVVPEDGARAAQALEWARSGMDFADALHLASSASCSAFVSFDRKLAKAAAKLAAPPIKSP